MNASGIGIGFWIGFGDTQGAKAQKPKKQQPQGHQYPGCVTLPSIDYSYGSIPNNGLCSSAPSSYGSYGSSFPSRVPSPAKSEPAANTKAERNPAPVPEELTSTNK